MDVPEKKTPRQPRSFSQFSLRVLLGLVTVTAVASLIYAQRIREHRKMQRPFDFVAAIEEGDFKKVDELLEIDPTLAHGRQRYLTTWNDTALQMSLVRSGDPAVSEKLVARILQESPGLNEPNSDGETALTLVCKSQITAHSRLKFVSLLLAAGADPNVSFRSDGRSCLYLAADAGDEKTMTALLDAGADVNAADSEGNTALHLVMSNNWIKPARLLAKGGASLVVRNAQGDIPGAFRQLTLWWDAIDRLYESGNVAEIDQLLEAAPEVLAWANKHPLIVQAAIERKVGLLQYLLERGADPNLKYRDWNGAEWRTPLHAVAMRHWDWGMEHTDATNAQLHKIIQVMVDAGADVAAKDGNGRTALHGAAISQNHIVAQALLEHGADVNAVSKDGTSIIDMLFDYQFHPDIGPQTMEVLVKGGHQPTVLYAAATGNIDLLKKFQQEDPEFINRELTRKKITPIFVAVAAGQLEATKWLIGAGADLSVRTPRYWSTAWDSSLLCLASSYGHVEVAILLIESGIELNEPDFMKTLPLHQAALGAVAPEVFTAMLEHGADLTLRFNGKTVRETLEQRMQFHGERKHAVMMEILKKHEAKEESKRNL